jgi:hypothetical protein
MQLPFSITLAIAILTIIITCIFTPLVAHSSPVPIYSIPVHVIRVDSVKIDDDQIENWINNANDIFNPAGIRLVLVSSSAIVDPNISTMTAGLSNPGVIAATKEAAKYPGKLVVFFRDGADGNGFSLGNYEFVAMPQFNMTWLCKAKQTPAGECLDTMGNPVDWEQNAGQLAHDVGHYFGLNHTFPGFTDLNYNLASATQKFVDSGFNVNVFDGDSLGDTPPDPGAGVYANEGWHKCNADHTSYIIGTIVTATIIPDRNNLMGYFGCDPNLLSPMQIDELRATVEDRMQSGLTSWTIGDDEHIAGLTPEGHAHEFYYVPEVGHWQHSDLSLDPTVATRLLSRSGLTSWTIGDDEHVAGLESDGGVHEFYYFPEAGNWRHSFVTKNAEGPLLNPGAGLTSWTIGDDEHIAGISYDGSLHEFYYFPDVGRWQHTDVTRNVGGDKMRPSITSWTIGDDEHIVGLAHDGSVHEFYYIPDIGQWQHSDVTQNAGGPKLNSRSSLTSWTIGDDEHIAGLTPEGSVHEFYYIPDIGQWQHSDVTQNAGGPKLNPGLQVSYSN